MKKTAYLKPLIEVSEIETEQFIAASDAIGTNIDDLGVDNDPTDEEGRARLFLFDDED